MRHTSIAAVIVLLCSAPALAGRLAKPKDYTPDKSWPVVVSTQDNPNEEMMGASPFFLVHAGGQGVECGTKIESELATLAKLFNIDPRRIYATSFSRGGHEILLQTAYHPHWFAAIAPVCNDLRQEPQLIDVEIIRTPTMLLHGTGDSFRQTGLALFERMKKVGCPVQFESYAGGHDPKPVWNKTPKVWMQFFAKHVLEPYPKTVEHRVTHKRYSRAYWIDATMTKDAADMNARFKVTVGEGNQIKVEANEQVAALDLYLTDKLIDPAKPVKVTMGDKTLFEGPAGEELTVKVNEGTAYEKKEKKPLWEELTAIGKAAGYKYNPIDLAAAVEAFEVPAPKPKPATTTTSAAATTTKAPASTPAIAPAKAPAP